MTSVTPRGAAGTLVIDLLEAAVRVEGRGQLNIGKLLRACAAATAGKMAAARGFPRATRALVTDLRDLSERLGATDVPEEIRERLTLAAEVMERGGFADLGRFPDLSVCRRCGSPALEAPRGSCPRCGAHPLTFESFSTTYWSGEWPAHTVVDRLGKNVVLFREALSRIPVEHRAWAPSTSEWSTLAVLRHVRDANALFAERVDLILEADDPRLEVRSTYAWADQDPADGSEALFEAYASQRRGVVERLARLGPDHWARTGRHAAVGRVTLSEQASFFAAHELTHLRQLEALRRTLSRARDEPGSGRP